MAKNKQNLSSTSFTVILALVVVAILGYLIVTESSAQTEDFIVSVNGYKITQEELDTEFSRIPPALQAQLSKDEFLEQLVDSRLLIQTAAQTDILPTDEQVDQQIAVLKQPFPSEQAFEQALANEGITAAELRETMANQIAMRTLVEREVLANIEISSSEVSEYYVENLDQFTAPNGVIRVAHILVETLEEAEEVKSLLDAGSDFTELANERSQDPSVAVNSGELGFVERGRTVQAFEEAAFSLSVGEVSDPVQTQFGYHIIVRRDNSVSLQEATPTIENLLKQSREEGALAEYVSNLRKTANIQYAGVPEKNMFSSTGASLCTDNGKPVVTFYTSSSCTTCRQAQVSFEQVTSQFDVSVFIWELDTGDNLATAEKETALSRDAFDMLKTYNPNAEVPAYLIGCQYVRMGNAYETLNPHVEEEELRVILEEVV